VGLENFRRLLADPVFWNSIKLQFIWAAISVVFLVITSVFLALIVEEFVPIKWMSPIFRTILFMPMMMSMVCIGMLWQKIYNPVIGLLNSLLHFINVLDQNTVIDLLGNGKTALFAVFIPIVWQVSGFGMVILSAAMQNISQDIMEASLIDGCNKYSRIWHITFPMIKPTVTTLATIHLIGGLKCFEIIYVMTGGGPGIDTTVTAVYLFKTAFVNNEYGYGSAISVVLFLLTLLFGYIFFSFNKRLETYV
jgi:raffinose/stachyose/melibiose transport system permease protein